MKKEFEIHPAQAEILNGLLFVPEAGFAELNTTDLSNDHFTFHIKRLVEVDLVAKTPSGKYQLTQTGKEFANRFDTDEKKIEKQAKLGVLLVIEKKIGGVTKYLYQERLKQPYYGFWGCMTGKIRWGETVFNAASRELKEETGLSGESKLVHIWHKIDVRTDGSLLEDKYFYVVHLTKVAGTLTKDFDGGHNEWLTKDELTKIKKKFRNAEDTITMAEEGELGFRESTYTYTKDEY